MGSSVVTVENNSTFELTDFVLTERGEAYYFPIIGPGQKLSKKFHFKYEGSVHYRLSLSEIKKEGLIFGYVSGDLADKATMIIKKDGSIEIRN
jgi:hypothetical protein